MKEIDRNADMADTETKTEAVGFFSPEQGKALAQQGYELLIRVATKAEQIAFGLLVISGLICGSAFVLGALALSGTSQTVWLVFGGLVTLLGVGASFRSWRSLTSITERAAGIHESFRKLLATTTETKTFRSLNEADVETMGVFKQALLTRRIRKTMKSSIAEFRDLSSAFASVGAFPSVVIAAVVAIAISATFGAMFLGILLF